MTLCFFPLDFLFYILLAIFFQHCFGTKTPGMKRNNKHRNIVHIFEALVKLIYSVWTYNFRYILGTCFQFSENGSINFHRKVGRRTNLTTNPYFRTRGSTFGGLH